MDLMQRKKNAWSNASYAPTLGERKVIVKPGEGFLPCQSVILVSQVFTIDKTRLEGKMRVIFPMRVLQILDGLRLLTEPEGVVS